MANLFFGYWQHVVFALFFRHDFRGLKENSNQLFALLAIATLVSFLVSESISAPIGFFISTFVFALISPKFAIIYCLLSVGIDVLRFTSFLAFDMGLNNPVFATWELFGILFYAVKFFKKS